MPAEQHVSLGAPALTALSMMSRLATSVAADPSLGVQQEDQNRLAMESGTAAFELNYPYVYPSMKADQPTLFKNFKMSTYRASPGPGRPGSPSAASTWQSVPTRSIRSLPCRRALCLRDKASQLDTATVGGLPPTLASVYNDPVMFADYPFHAASCGGRQPPACGPETPAYQVVSIDYLAPGLAADQHQPGEHREEHG